jgi:hypothetical protein
MKCAEAKTSLCATSAIPSGKAYPAIVCDPTQKIAPSDAIDHLGMVMVILLAVVYACILAFRRRA